MQEVTVDEAAKTFSALLQKVIKGIALKRAFVFSQSKSRAFANMRQLTRF